jgi:hypothetical protein
MAWWVDMEEKEVASEGRMEKGVVMVVWVGTRWWKAWWLWVRRSGG